MTYKSSFQDRAGQAAEAKRRRSSNIARPPVDEKPAAERIAAGEERDAAKARESGDEEGRAQGGRGSGGRGCRGEGGCGGAQVGGGAEGRARCELCGEEGAAVRAAGEVDASDAKCWGHFAKASADVGVFLLVTVPLS